MLVMRLSSSSNTSKAVETKSIEQDASIKSLKRENDALIAKCLNYVGKNELKDVLQPTLILMGKAMSKSKSTTAVKFLTDSGHTVLKSHRIFQVQRDAIYFAVDGFYCIELQCDKTPLTLQLNGLALSENNSSSKCTNYNYRLQQMKAGGYIQLVNDTGYCYAEEEGSTMLMITKVM
jgi:hypothetical protein